MIPNIAYLPESPQNPGDYAAWAEKVAEHRLVVYYETEDSNIVRRDEARDREAKRCKEDGLYLAATYGTIYEARPSEDLSDEDQFGASAYIPFIPYPHQIDVYRELDAVLKRKGTLGDALILKCREMGLSNLVCFWVAHGWMCRYPFSIRMLSRVREDVDSSGDPDSLFWKIETFLKGLPEWLFSRLVPGFRWREHRMNLKFINPANANFIAGESTQENAGRGGRATAIIYDEAAFIDNFGAVWTAGRGTTRHRIALTTANISDGMDFYNMWTGRDGYTETTKIAIPWDLHPLHTREWLEEERTRDSEEGIQREVFMNFFAGNTELVYPDAQKLKPISAPYEPHAGPLYVTMDDGFDDDFAIVWIQYIRATGRFRVFQGYRNTKQIVGFYGSLLKGVPEQRFADFYHEREREIMKNQQLLPPPIYTGDAHLKNTEQLTGDSPLEYLLREYGINAFTTLQGREHRVRRIKLGDLLPYMDFDDGNWAPEVLEALQRYRFKTVKEGRDQLAEYKTPLHDKYSHYVTALEWFATNWDYIKVASDHDSIKWTGTPAQ